jgi:NAD(P)H-flavin reductase
VRERREETADTVTLVLDAGDAGLPFQPGQFNMLYVHGQGEAAISIAGDPAEPGLLVHTVRAVGAVSRPLAAMNRGDWVGVRGPFGTGWPLVEAEGTDVVVVSGGIGLAPLRPALLHLYAHRERYGRIILLHGARSPGDLLYAGELGAWRARFDTTVEVTVDRAAPGWWGPVGVVTRLLERAAFDPDDATVLTCGPELMMGFVAREALNRGVPAAALWLSLERNMKCGVRLCGHCQWGAAFLCRDGPVFRYGRVAKALSIREL